MGLKRHGLEMMRVNFFRPVLASQKRRAVLGRATGTVLGLLVGTVGASSAKAGDLPLPDTLSDEQTYYMINYTEHLQKRCFMLTWTNSVYYRKLLEKKISLDSVARNEIIHKAYADANEARAHGDAVCDTFKEQLDMASALLR